jgi:tRNA dimethylallyltransferase
MDDHPAIAVVGPTASGKSQLAMAVAMEFRGEIISCDALQVYRGMDIGTAKPTTAERACIPHHMLDLRNPGEDFSAGDYQRIGRDVLQAVVARGNLPIVAGGTGFYLRALIDGLFAGPGRSEALRSRIRKVLSHRGPARLHCILSRVDPRSAERISAADVARILRALEVWFLTRRPLSSWQDQPRVALSGFRWLKLGIAWPRERLYRRIDARVEQMYRDGLVEESRALLRTYPRDCHAFKAIGYRQCSVLLDGACTLEQAISGTQQQTRRYAKRQLTWFRSLPDLVWLEGDEDFSPLVSRASELIRNWLLAGTAPTVQQPG